ncbi:transport permease protein [Microtetraspora sp. NBRC 13810]|uniref:ABC transporter permease n=1 Tax=Microtetraspora sp. NBRC 13810 TaxID=3030990 RepID=UPI0024A08FCF|nr:ABC transporter permease [Microtetraspora sp. NBRC 13810]GLW08013.1 transport permease protein [Microtetraspora sp. NBRC 13810]
MKTVRKMMGIGVRRGWAEFVHLVKDRKEQAGQLLGTVGVFVLLLLWIGDEPVKGTDVSSGTLMTAGFLAFTITSGGLLSLAMMIAADREDGTMLRLRATAGGIPVYLIGRGVTVLCQIVLQCGLMLGIGLALGSVTFPSSPADWLTLAWVVPLGTLAVVSLGAAIGSVLPSPKTAAVIMGLPMMGAMLISGVMLPMSYMPEPVQWIAQALPLYWQGLGLRSVFLPDSMLAAEIGGAWRLPETAAVLGAWAVAGLLLAAWLLRRATRRESGSRLAERRLAAQAAN